MLKGFVIIKNTSERFVVPIEIVIPDQSDTSKVNEKDKKQWKP